MPQTALIEVAPSFKPSNPAEIDLDEAFTPQPIFNVWNEVLKLTVDAFSCAAAAKLPRFWTKADDAFNRSWAGERVYVNNPYTLMTETAEKIDHEMRNGCELVLALWPGNRGEQPFAQKYVEQNRDGRGFREVNHRILYVHTLNIAGRISFEGPAATSGGGKFPSLLVLWHFQPTEWLALLRAETQRTFKEGA